MLLLWVHKMDTSKKSVLPTNIHKFRNKPKSRGTIMSDNKTIKTFEELVVLKQKDDNSFITNESKAVEETVLVIKVGVDEYSLTIPVVDDAEVLHFQTLITECLNMTSDEFDLFEDNFPKVVKEHFGIDNIELAEELTSIVAMIRRDSTNQEPEDQPTPLEPTVEQSIPEPAPKPEPAPVSETNPVMGFIGTSRSMAKLFVSMGKSKQ